MSGTYDTQNKWNSPQDDQICVHHSVSAQGTTRKEIATNNLVDYINLTKGYTVKVAVRLHCTEGT